MGRRRGLGRTGARSGNRAQPAHSAIGEPSGSDRLNLWDRPRSQPPSFEQLDQNHDGKLGRDEIDELDWERLQGADVNHDGVITRAEYDAARARQSGSH